MIWPLGHRGMRMEPYRNYAAVMGTYVYQEIYGMNGGQWPTGPGLAAAV